jgi:Lon protease-like protein
MTVPLTLHSLPLFPLGAVLFPAGRLPLQIFEVRYLDMINRCHKTGAPFGVVALSRGAEVQKRESGSGPSEPAASGLSQDGNAFAVEAFESFGTLATITQLQRPQPGLIVVQCLGTRRFQITKREKLKHGLWVADVTLLSDDQLVSVPPDLQGVADSLGQIIRNLQLQRVPLEQWPFTEPYNLSDCAWVANRWCELLQLPLHVKHGLMALENPLIRLELVRDLLEQAGIQANSA